MQLKSLDTKRRLRKQSGLGVRHTQSRQSTASASEKGQGGTDKNRYRPTQKKHATTIARYAKVNEEKKKKREGERERARQTLQQKLRDLSKANNILFDAFMVSDMVR